MTDRYDYKQFAVLYVDDEEKSLKSFARAFGETFRILTASSARSGFELLEQHQQEVGVLMTDQKMPGEKGVWLLERARKLQPRVIRILVTAYSDMDAAIAAVNAGSIYRYINKPWDPVQLEQTLKQSLEFFMVQRERDRLLKEKMSVLHNLMIADRIISLGLLSAGLSHHIRNALVAVKTFVDLAPSKMQEEKGAPDKLRSPEFWQEYYQNVQGQMQKIDSLLQDVVRAAQDPSLQFKEAVRLHETIAEVLHGLSAALVDHHIQFENHVPASLPVLQVDPPKFAQLFEFLLKDELASLPPGSTIQLSARVVPGDTAVSRSAVEVRLHDNGPGLSKDALRSLFDPFVARSGRPTEYGINLMACYFLVHYHGGRIYAESGPDQGTTFTLRLPVNPNAAPASDERAEFLHKILLNETLWENMASE